MSSALLRPIQRAFESILGPFRLPEILQGNRQTSKGQLMPWFSRKYLFVFGFGLGVFLQPEQLLAKGEAVAHLLGILRNNPLMIRDALRFQGRQIRMANGE